jgi:hypothetical protein
MGTNTDLARIVQNDNSAPNEVEQQTNAEQSRRHDDLNPPPAKFGGQFGLGFVRDVEQLKRDADAASLTEGAN